MRAITFYFVILFSWSQAQSQIIPFGSDRWEIEANEYEIKQYLGQESLFMKGGIAYLKDVDFLNGTLEFDLAIPNDRGFMGALWRLQDNHNYEEFYVRPHQSGNPDANQYTPIFNRLAGWQLYHGNGYGAPVDYQFDQWTHIKIAISDGIGEVYINQMDTPAVVIHELKREVKPGKIGVDVGNFAPAHFANFQFDTSNPVLKGAFEQPEAPAPGTIMSWMVSNTFAEDIVKDKVTITETDIDSLTWTRLGSESTGITNLARISKIEQGNTVFARITIESDREQIKGFKLGYSDRVRLYLNGILHYSGDNGFRTRDYRYLGTIGLFDEVHLPLKEGNNTLMVAVSESFGGWGILARIDDREGIRIK